MRGCLRLAHVLLLSMFCHLVHSSYHVLPTFFAVPHIHIFAPSHMSTVHAMSACCSLLLFHAVQGAGLSTSVIPAYSSKFVCVLFPAGPGPIKQILPPSPQQFACICCRLSRIWPSGCPRMLQFRGRRHRDHLHTQFLSSCSGQTWYLAHLGLDCIYLGLTLQHSPVSRYLPPCFLQLSTCFTISTLL